MGLTQLRGRNEDQLVSIVEFGGLAGLFAAAHSLKILCSITNSLSSALR
jgi:hypothetical protein